MNLRRSFVAALLLLAIALINPVPLTASGTLQLEVKLSERKLYVRENGKVTKTYDVAVGKSQHPTPRGNFQIRRLIWNPSWTPPDENWAKDKNPAKPGDPNNPMRVVKIFFKQPDYYIHGTKEKSSLGKRASHGCVRMSEDEVAELGKLVMKYGGQPKPASWFRRITSRKTAETEINLSKPVRLRITA
jgi:murein L,D-transpeptidase YcbB/YkuD